LPSVSVTGAMVMRPEELGIWLEEVRRLGSGASRSD
jgi:hypothetical protein